MAVPKRRHHSLKFLSCSLSAEVAVNVDDDRNTSSCRNGNETKEALGEQSSTMSVIFDFCIVIYVILAALFVLYVWKREKGQVRRWLAVAFVILLPSWDAVLGIIVYYSACPFMTATIYDTAETSGIYYEGKPRNHLLSTDGRYLGIVQRVQGIPFAADDFEKGYQYVESLITSVGDHSQQIPLSPPRIFRCTPLSNDPKNPQARYQQCIAVDEIRSGYLVKMTRYEFQRNTISIMKIYNRSTNQLMGEYRQVTRSIDYMPFFTWLYDPFSGPGSSQNYPEGGHLYDYQFKVLKVKK